MFHVQNNSWLKLHAGICPEWATLRKRSRVFSIIILITLLLSGLCCPPVVAQDTSVNPAPAAIGSSEAAKPTSPAVTSEKSEAAKELPKQAETQRVITPKFKPYYLLIGVLIGLLIGIMRLVARFLPFRSSPECSCDWPCAALLCYDH